MKQISDYEMYRIMIENDLDGTIDRIIEKNNQLTRQDVKIEELEEENKKLHSIIEEAIEYIVHPTFTGKHSTNEEVLVDILRILKGVDKE